jgi:hypothetical protein
MTGTKAKASPKVGAKYTATDDYIWGTNLELVPGKKIVQSWRSTDFVDGENDSVITVTLEPVAGGTMLTLQHSDIPDTQADGGYEQGWFDYYFEPMKSYFGKAAKQAKPKAVKPKAKKPKATKAKVSKPKAAAKKPKAAKRAATARKPKARKAKAATRKPKAAKAKRK